MQIIDRFDDKKIFVVLVCERKNVPWNAPNNDEYVGMFLRALRSYANDKRRVRGLYSLYDLCLDLSLGSKPIYAHLGWGKDDEIDFDYDITETEVIVSLKCNFL